MSIEEVRGFLQQYGKAKDILEMNDSTATVELAAQALGIEPARIAKSISLQDGDSGMIVVVAGDAKIDNKKFKEEFGFKAKMLTPKDTLSITGHPVGGVCPFALPKNVKVFLDESMKRFATMYPACGSHNSAIEVTLIELEQYSQSRKWIDVSKIVT
ncbi:YbaK/EbsC family protein [Alkalibaculum sp. M08DMB]|uniref:YbaK/EbsC family protein n=1 Tax=Alkalibaculum sporogenes TaxID=2655001 RepID=A0A6A7K4K4_9FIRM|nr:YbaK/EbsC family protein [Alkalibaculum sporogenes]MPW24318.1 YbaK/EbsC family protein [Alkalibaculum sporogenes]